ncbi:hypothetical protein BJX65DRAFT_321310 [Aspergillus insuetus]
MSHRLPLELWLLIAKDLESNRLSFTRYALVCRHWRAVFEPLLYSKVRVHSVDFKIDKGTMSLEKFQSLTSGRASRQTFIRNLDYTIILPYRLDDYRSVKLKGTYNEQNPVREANDEAFKAGVMALFRPLASWCKGHQIFLTLQTLGREQAREPGTEAQCHADQWQHVLDGEEVVRPYRARFPHHDTSMLPQVGCVTELGFRVYYPFGDSHSIHCRGLQILSLSTNELVRPDHLSYSRERREAIARELPNLPSSLQTLNYWGTIEQPWSNILPGLNLLGNDDDLLSANIRQLSLGLKELTLTMTSLGIDFLFPLDETCKPLPNVGLAWPLLEILEFKDVPYSLPSGEWLLDWDRYKWDDEDIDDPTTAGIEIFDTGFMSGDAYIERDIISVEQLHRLFISLGYAARRMPRLIALEFDLVALEHTFELLFVYETFYPPCLEWITPLGYLPDERVAEAWGFRLEDYEVKGSAKAKEFLLIILEVS